MCGIEFELSDETRKVCCQTCLGSNIYEPWIHRSSAQSHLKSDHHRKSEVAKKQHEETQERLSTSFTCDAEHSAAMWDMFLTPKTLPSIQVNSQERVSPAHPTEEECEQPQWLIDQFINYTKDLMHPEAKKHDQSLNEWMATEFGEDVLLGPDKEDETVTNVLNAACLFFH